MRLKNIATFFLLITLIVLSCAKEYSYEGGNSPSDNDSTNNPPVKSEWEFTQATKYYGPVDTAYLTSQDSGQIITVTGKSASADEKIFISIRSFDGAIQKGVTYKTSKQQIKFLYTGLADTLYSALPYYGGDISVTITDIASDRIVGTFQGLVLDKNKKLQNITDGKFSSPLKTVPESASSCYLMLWAKEDCNGPIKVKVNNQLAEISVFSLITPDCGDAGRATYNLSPGTYDWVAYCGKDSVFGKAEVKAGSCSKILVMFPFKPATVTETGDDSCKVSDVSYSGCLFTRCPPYYDSYKPIANKNSSAYTGNTMNSMTYTVYALGFAVTHAHPVSYETNKIIIDAGTQTESYFITDAKGRIIKYYGLKDPATIYPLDSTIITYEYDNNNNLVKRIVTDARYLTTKKETNFIWQNGNVVKMIENNVAGGGENETDFEYYTDKEIHSLPFTFTNAFELLLFQPAVNFGNSIKNPLKTETIHAYDVNGSPVSKSYDFTNYILDDNNYVLQFQVADQYGTNTDFSFKYKCF